MNSSFLFMRSKKKLFFSRGDITEHIILLFPDVQQGTKAKSSFLPGKHPKEPDKRTRKQDEELAVVPEKMLWIQGIVRKLREVGWFLVKKKTLIYNKNENIQFQKA